jgi:hypothetical protein
VESAGLDLESGVYGSPPKGGLAGDGPLAAAPTARAPCLMIKRTFDHASQAGDDELEQATATCLEIWLRALRASSDGWRVLAAERFARASAPSK